MTNPKDKPVREITPEVLQGLTVKWMECFVSAARVGDRKGFGGLFHEHCVVFGGEKGGCVDWDMAHQFVLDVQNAKIHPIMNHPGSLCVVDWVSQPIIDMAQRRSGHATFYFVLLSGNEEGKLKFECMHAHFSAIKE